MLKGRAHAPPSNTAALPTIVTSVPFVVGATRLTETLALGLTAGTGLENHAPRRA